MLTTPSAPRRPLRRAHGHAHAHGHGLSPWLRASGLAASGFAALGAAAALAGPLAAPLGAQSTTPMPGLTPEGRAERPPGFVLLEERRGFEGLRAVGVFSPRPDPGQAGLWRVQLWEESDGRVTVATDKVGCRPGAALRITGRGRALIVRELNPGGLITPANRLDHLIWWAVCHPTLAGRDPATLSAEARRLGFDGQRPESEQILPAP
jgi:hypothetical protein